MGPENRKDEWALSGCRVTSSFLSCDKSQFPLIDETPGEGIDDNGGPLGGPVLGR